MITETGSGELKIKSSTAGAGLTSIACDGIEYLWQGDPEYWSGQSPVCFPICGSLRGDRATCGAGEVSGINRHGFARKSEFELVNAEADSIDYVLKSSDATRAIYPYDFAFTLGYRLSGRTLTFSYTVENTGSVDMPFFIGGHPAFRCPLLPGEDYTDYVIEFEKEEYANCCFPLMAEPTLLDDGNRRVIMDHTKVLKLDHSLFLHDGLVFDDLSSRHLTYRNPATGKGVKIDFEDFENLVIWSTDKPAEFVAIEPWNGYSTTSAEDDVLEHKASCQVVAPGQKAAYHFDVTIL